MKHIFYMLVSGSIVILVMIALLTIRARDIKTKEMNDALSAAMYETLQQLQESSTYRIDDGSIDENKFIKDFTKGLLHQIKDGTELKHDENLAVKIQIAGFDVKKGLLSVKVSEEFTYPNGKVGCIQNTATAVLEQAEEKPNYTITFHLPDRVYKQYSIQKDENFKIPSNPSMSGKTFKYWIDDATGTQMSFPTTVTENKSYTAVFEQEGGIKSEEIKKIFSIITWCTNHCNYTFSSRSVCIRIKG